jgi:hypothetical protein
MFFKKIAILSIATLFVAVAAISTAEAGVGGCRAGWCGGGGNWEKASLSPTPGSGRHDVLSSLQWILPRDVYETVRVFVGGGPKDRVDRPVHTPPGNPTIEGVGGCRGPWCGSSGAL